MSREFFDIGKGKVHNKIFITFQLKEKMPPAEGQQQAAQQQFSWSSLIFRAALIYLAFSYFSPFKTTNVEETVITTETGIQQEGNDILINAPPIEGGDAKNINTKPTKQTHYPIYSKQQQLVFNNLIFLI